MKNSFFMLLWPHSTVCLGCYVPRSVVYSLRCQYFSFRLSRCSRVSINFLLVGFTGLVFSCSFSSVLARARPWSHLRQGPVFSRAVRSSWSSCSRGQRARSNFFLEPVCLRFAWFSARSVFSSLGFLLVSSQQCLVPQWLHRSVLLAPTRIAHRPHRSFPRVAVALQSCACFSFLLADLILLLCNCG
jgi:hypothetical protein